MLEKKYIFGSLRSWDQIPQEIDPIKWCISPEDLQGGN